MHSFSDCVMGITLGAAICAVQVAFGDMFDDWLTTRGWTGIILLPFLIMHRLT